MKTKVYWRIYSYPGSNLLPVQVGKIQVPENSKESEVIKLWKEKTHNIFSSCPLGKYRAFTYQILWYNN